MNSLFLKHASLNRVEHSPFHDRTAALRGDSHDNQLVSNDSLKVGLHFQANQEGAML